MTEEEDWPAKKRLQEYLKEELRQRLRQRMKVEHTKKDPEKLGADIRAKRLRQLFDLLSERLIDEYFKHIEKMGEIPLPEQIEAKEILSGDKTFIYQIRIKPKKEGQK